jgi:hypothetical protein
VRKNVNLPNLFEDTKYYIKDEVSERIRKNGSYMFIKLSKSQER